MFVELVVSRGLVAGGGWIGLRRHRCSVNLSDAHALCVNPICAPHPGDLTCRLTDNGSESLMEAEQISLSAVRCTSTTAPSNRTYEGSSKVNVQISLDAGSHWTQLDAASKLSRRPRDSALGHRASGDAWGSHVYSGGRRGPPEADRAPRQCGNGAPALLVSTSTNFPIKLG